MPGLISIRSDHVQLNSRQLTILHQDIEAFFDGQGGVKYDESKTKREDIVAGTDSEKVTDCALEKTQ